MATLGMATRGAADWKKKYKLTQVNPHNIKPYRLRPEYKGVKMSLFAENRARLARRMREDGLEGVVLLEGAKTSYRDATDSEDVLRQESFFNWAFGVRESGIYGAIDVATGKSVLFVPKGNFDHLVWMGKFMVPQDYMDAYGVDAVYHYDEGKGSSAETNDMAKWLLDRKDKPVFRLRGWNTDQSKMHEMPAPRAIKHLFDAGTPLKVEKSKLWRRIVDLRVVKTEKELELMRYATQVSCKAHKELMKRTRPGWSEFQAEALFLHEVYAKGGHRHASYTCNAATGKKGAILHYGHAGEPNSQVIEDGAMASWDMGGEYYGYTADVTCAFPANGKFTANQRIVYGAVLAGWKAVKGAMKPGASWKELHLIAERAMLQHMIEKGLLRVPDAAMSVKDGVQAMVDDRLAGKVFFSHGMGHLIGCDTHDVGGYWEKDGKFTQMPDDDGEGSFVDDMAPERTNLAGLSSLRTSRIMQENMTLTIEPGWYFPTDLIEVVRKAGNEEERAHKGEVTTKEYRPFAGLSKYIVWERMDDFLDFGGVRIESVVRVTADGCEDFCDEHIPREMDEIEKLMRGAGAPAPAFDDRTLEEGVLEAQSVQASASKKLHEQEASTSEVHEKEMAKLDELESKLDELAAAMPDKAMHEDQLSKLHGVQGQLEDVHQSGVHHTILMLLVLMLAVASVYMVQQLCNGRSGVGSRGANGSGRQLALVPAACAATVAAAGALAVVIRRRRRRVVASAEAEMVACDGASWAA